MHLLYQTQFFSSYQCDRQRCFYVDFGHKKVRLDFCQLLSLRHRLNRIRIEAHLEGNHPGLEILCLCNKAHLFVFNTTEILELMDLIKGTLGILELNSMVSC